MRYEEPEETDLNYKKWGLRGRKASPLPGAGMDSPLIALWATSIYFISMI